MLRSSGQFVLILAIAAVLFTVPASTRTLEGGDAEPFVVSATGAIPANVWAVRSAGQQPKPAWLDLDLFGTLAASLRDVSRNYLSRDYRLSLPSLGSLRC